MIPIDADLVHRLLAAQFPRWADLPIRPVVPGGNDHRTFRLGDTLSVRLPSAAGYAPQVDKEQRHLPFLAPRLPVPIPVPIARGRPGAGYPFDWSVLSWLPGDDARPGADQVPLAVDLARFLTALQQIDPTDGPAPGLHSAYRGGPPAFYDDDTRRALDALHGRVDTAAATAIWDAALDAPWDGRPVWFHGDVAAGNLLVRDGRLAAVIDFGCAGVGDPACDLTVAWTLLSGAARRAFREGLPADAGTWARGRGWALWKSLIVLAGADPAPDADAVLCRVLADPVAR